MQRLTTILAAAGALAVLATAIPAQAEWHHDWHGGRGWYDHGWHGRAGYAPGYVIAPPVVYAPPSVYLGPPAIVIAPPPIAVGVPFP
jgi:hypothetical protein